MAKKVRYYYDDQDCTFKPEQVTAKAVAIKGLSYIIGVSVFSCLLLVAIFFLYDNPKEALLKKQNTDLITKVGDLEESFAILENQVNSLHSTDNTFYRSLMNVDRIDPGYWSGGTGGAVNIDRNGEPEALRDVEKRLDRLFNKIDIQKQSYSFLFKKLKDNDEELRHTPAIKPVPGKVISGFGMRMHPIHKIRKPHTGLDMQASTGTAVHAAADGVIKLAGTSRGGYGKQVEIDHGGFGYVTKYAHLSKINIKKGQRVKRGDIIGYSGNTGLSKGPHLHYEIIKNGTKIDPIDYFYGDLTPEEYVRLRAEAKVENMSMD